MAPEPSKPSCCVRLSAPQILALAAATALAILAVALMTELPKRGEPVPLPSAPSETVPTQPLLMQLREVSATH